MAAAAATLALTGMVPARNVSSISSSAAFGCPLVNLAAPFRRPAASRCNVVIAKMDASEEQTSKVARREMLASLVGAGAAFAVAGNAMAASGPGTQGGKRTNQKADELLKAADDLTENDSPPRYGPGRIDNSGDAGRVAQKAGSGAIEQLQGGTTQAVDQAKENVTAAKKRIDNIFQKKNPTGDLSSAEIGEKVSSDLKSSGEKVKSDISSASGKVKSDIDGFIGSGNKADEAKDSAGDFVAQAKQQADDVSSDASNKGKSILDTIADKAQNLIPQ